MDGIGRLHDFGLRVLFCVDTRGVERNPTLCPSVSSAVSGNVDRLKEPLTAPERTARLPPSGSSTASELTAVPTWKERARPAPAARDGPRCCPDSERQTARVPQVCDIRR
jgi:hypothetical protein